MTTIYCSVAEKGKLAFYLEANGKDYYLFMQKYRKSTKEYFGKGRPVSDSFSMAGVHSAAVRRVIERLRSAITYVEKEYDICVLKSSEKKANRKKANKKKGPYKRQRFSWGTLYAEAVEAI